MLGLGMSISYVCIVDVQMGYGRVTYVPDDSGESFIKRPCTPCLQIWCPLNPQTCYGSECEPRLRLWHQIVYQVRQLIPELEPFILPSAVRN